MSDQTVVCQNDSPMRGSFWHKDSLITHILFELQPIMLFSPVANFGHHPLRRISSFYGFRSQKVLTICGQNQIGTVIV